MAAIAGACRQSEFASSEELSEYVLDSDNGLSGRRTIGDVDVEVVFQPSDMMVAREVDASIAEGDLVILRKKYCDYYYFLLTLSRDGKEIADPAMSNYSDILQTLSFNMNQFVRIKTSGEGIPPADFIHARTFGMSSKTTVLVAFSKEKLKGDSDIEFELDEFGIGIGVQKFVFSSQQLKHAPIINFTTVKNKI